MSNISYNELCDIISTFEKKGYISEVMAEKPRKIHVSGNLLFIEDEEFGHIILTPDLINNISKGFSSIRVQLNKVYNMFGGCELFYIESHKQA